MSLTIEEKIERIRKQAKEAGIRINKKRVAQKNIGLRNDEKIEALEEQIREYKNKNKTVSKNLKKIDREWEEKKEIYEFKMWRLNKSKK
jgi:hypothetical protein